GDWVIYNGSIWEKSLNSDAVVSVNGFTGAVVLDTNDISENNNLYFTDERAQDAVGNILNDTSTIAFDYNDVDNEITANVVPNSITNTELNSGIDATKIADGSVTDTEFQYLNGTTSNLQTQLDNKQNKLDGSFGNFKLIGTDGSANIINIPGFEYFSTTGGLNILLTEQP